MLVIMALGFTTAFTGHIYGYTGGPYQLFNAGLDGSSYQPDEYIISYDESSFNHRNHAEAPSTQSQPASYKDPSSEQTCEDVFGADNPLCALLSPEPPDASERAEYPMYRPG
jgi:hypothetical protein